MKVVVFGASGNCGSAVVRELSDAGHDVLGVARRRPPLRASSDGGSSVAWRTADVAQDDLGDIVGGADAVVHLAWMFQPTHRPDITWQANAVGTRRVLDAVAARQVPVVVVASSLAAYSPSLDDHPVDETWPTDGPSTAAYAREKAYVERTLDAFESTHPDIRTVRFRPAFVFQRSAGPEQRRIFGGAFLPRRAFDRRFIPTLPLPRGLRFQAVHADDLARAYRAAVERPVSGAFNVASDDVVRRAELGRLFDARTVEVPPAMVHAVISAMWRAHVLPVPANLFDAFMRIPVLSTERARAKLDWEPGYTSLQALAEMVTGTRENHGTSMPPLVPD